MGKIVTLNNTGHTATEWDVTDQESVERARAQFDQGRADGLMGVKTENGVGKEMLTRFEPKAEEIVMSRPVAGG